MQALLLQADQMAYKSKVAAIWCCMTNDYVEGCCCMCCWSSIYWKQFTSVRRCWCREVSIQITRLEMKMWLQVLHWIILRLYWIGKRCLPKMKLWYSWSILDRCTLLDQRWPSRQVAKTDLAKLKKMDFKFLFFTRPMWRQIFSFFINSDVKVNGENDLEWTWSSNKFCAFRTCSFFEEKKQKNLKWWGASF